MVYQKVMLLQGLIYVVIYNRLNCRRIKMIEVKKKHIKHAEETYYKNKDFFMKKIYFFKNISELKRIETLAELFAECEQRMKELNKKYPNGFFERN